MKKYEITNACMEDSITVPFEFSEEQFSFLREVFDKLNSHSFPCAPLIYIEESEGADDEKTTDE